MNTLLEMIKPEYLTATVVGGLIVWIFERIKSYSEIKKLKNEILSLQLKSNESYHSINQLRREVTKKIGQYLITLQKAKSDNNSKEEIIHARWQLIDFFYTEYIPAYDSFIKIARFVYEDDRQTFIEVDVLPFMETVIKIQGFINDQSVLDQTQEPKYEISSLDLKFAIKFVKNNIKKCDILTFEFFNQILNKLGFEKEQIHRSICIRIKKVLK